MAMFVALTICFQHPSHAYPNAGSVTGGLQDGYVWVVCKHTVYLWRAEAGAGLVSSSPVLELCIPLGCGVPPSGQLYLHILSPGGEGAALCVLVCTLQGELLVWPALDTAPNLVFPWSFSICVSSLCLKTLLRLVGLLELWFVTYWQKHLHVLPK